MSAMTIGHGATDVPDRQRDRASVALRLSTMPRPSAGHTARIVNFFSAKNRK